MERDELIGIIVKRTMSILRPYCNLNLIKVYEDENPKYYPNPYVLINIWDYNVEKAEVLMEGVRIKCDFDGNDRTECYEFQRRWVKLERINEQLFNELITDFSEYHYTFSLRTYNKPYVVMRIPKSDGGVVTMRLPTVMLLILRHPTYSSYSPTFDFFLGDDVDDHLEFYADALGMIARVRIRKKTEDYYRAMELLAPYRPKGKFYAFLSTIMNYGMTKDVEEALFLEDVVGKYDVWTADMRVADEVARGETDPEEYVKTLVKVNDLSSYPLYLTLTRDLGSMVLGLPMYNVIRSNEFIISFP